MRWPIVGAALVACAPLPIDQAELELAVSLAAEEGWAKAGLPRYRRCSIGDFQVAFPATEEAFLRVCPLAHACLSGKISRDGKTWYPVAYIHPDEPEEVWPRLAVHEAIHLLSSCAFGHPSSSHRDPWIWKVYWDGDSWERSPSSAEALAVEAL
jgi:hypothetical protein